MRRIGRPRIGNRSGQRGSVLAEFTIVSIAALTMIFGIIDFGRALYTYHLVSDGARIGTRYAIVNGAAACASSPDPLQAYVRGQAPGINPSQMTVTPSCLGGNAGCQSSVPPYNSHGCLISVTVAYSFHFLVPLVSKLTIPMSSTSQMVISQ